MIGVLIRGREELLDRLLKSIAEIDFPKENLILYFLVNNPIGRETDKLLDFREKYVDEYSSIIIHHIDRKNPPNIDACREGIDQDKFYDHVAELRNMVLLKARRYGVSYLFSIDSDILVPADSLKKLLSRDCDVVAGLVRNSPKSDKIFNYLYYDEDKKRFYRKKEEAPLLPFEVNLTGAAMLISRKAIMNGRYSSGRSGSDEGFALCMISSGIRQFIDPSVKCIHIMNGQELI